MLGAILCLGLFAPPALAGGLFGLNLFGSDSSAQSDATVDPVRYAPTLRLTDGNADLKKALKAASLLIAKKDEPPSGTVGLIQRARDDQANLIGKLYEEGYFGGTVSISLDGRQLDSISVTETIGSSGHTVAVAITVNAGPTFTFGRIAITGPTDQAANNAAAGAGLVAGAHATSTVIQDATNVLVLAWKKQGHPFAKIASQRIVADHASNTVDVAFEVSPGPIATIGDVRLRGTTALDTGFVERQAEVPVGAVYSPDIIEHIRKNLSRIDALGSAVVKTGDHVDAEGRVPLLIEVSERKPRSIGIGAFTSTTDGVGGDVYWLHRNLFGAGETLRLDAALARAITSGSYTDIATYTGHVGFQFVKPGVYGPRVDWLLNGQVLQEDFDPYYRRGITFETGFAYRLTDELTLTSTVAYDLSHVVDAFGARDYSLLSTPQLATYDSRDNALDATRGIYAQLRAEPQYATNTGTVFFTGDAELRAYHAIDDEGRLVIAARGRAGSIVGASLDEVPAYKRFYAGGGGSVRGYDYLGIGPSIPGYGPTGGLSRIDGSIEARYKLTNTIGIVAFSDAGLVTEKTLFGGDDAFQVSAGLGLRYYTSIGPLRLDVAVPINPRHGDPSFAVYFGIGQSF